MIQVRDVFQVKFGKIDQAVQLFGAMGETLAQHAPDIRAQVLVDVSGPMYTLVNEFQVANLARWEEVRDWTFGQEDFPDWFRHFQFIVESGRREFYAIEQANEGWSGPGVVVVRNGFRALKWQIRPTVELLKRYGALLVDCGVGRNPRCLTDTSGEMFTAVIEIETPGLSEWETQRRDLFRRPEFQVWFNQLTSHVTWGFHEFFMAV